MMRLHKKLLGEVPSVYRDAVSGAIIASTLISTGSSMIAASDQKAAAEEAERKRMLAAQDAEAEANRIAELTRPDEEGVGDIEFGIGDTDTGNIGDFLVKKDISSSSSSLGSGNGSGLGFKI